MIDIVYERLPRKPSGALNYDQLYREYGWAVERLGGTHHTGLDPMTYGAAIMAIAVIEHHLRDVS